jgi:Holliday junction resolvase RusA-like endonuclease
VSDEILDIYVRGIAQTKGSWKSINTRRGPRLIPDNPDEEAWATQIAWQAKLALKHKHGPDKRRYTVTILVELPPRAGRKSYNRDVDKLARSCLDALTGVIYADDEQVDRLVIEKCRGGVPGMRLIVSECDPTIEGHT